MPLFHHSLGQKPHPVRAGSKPQIWSKAMWSVKASGFLTRPSLSPIPRAEEGGRRAQRFWAGPRPWRRSYRAGGGVMGGGGRSHGLGAWSGRGFGVQEPNQVRSGWGAELQLRRGGGTRKVWSPAGRGAAGCLGSPSLSRVWRQSGRAEGVVEEVTGLPRAGGGFSSLGAGPEGGAGPLRRGNRASPGAGQGGGAGRGQGREVTRSARGRANSVQAGRGRGAGGGASGGGGPGGAAP